MQRERFAKIIVSVIVRCSYPSGRHDGGDDVSCDGVVLMLVFMHVFMLLVMMMHAVEGVDFSDHDKDGHVTQAPLEVFKHGRMGEFDDAIFD